MRAILLAALLSGAVTPSLAADAGWFQPGDTVLRNDLQLLNDAGVIRLPITEWPVPRAAVRYALEKGREHLATNQAVINALARVHARIDDVDTARARKFTIDTAVNTGEQGLLRDFDTLGRDAGEISGRGTWYSGEKMEASLNVTAVANPEDGDELRLDGSHATFQWGNWLFSANELDRWWGPGREGSLILSTNARPMPTLMVERATAQAFETKWLSWLGPWRMSFGVSQMEQEREDIDRPLFMAWRITIMPLKDLEIGLSRTAQFCGEQLPCNAASIKNMLLGYDNIGHTIEAGNEPGNQMAGYDLRWNSPIGNLPYAIYSQFIGEDVSSYVPAKYIVQYGLEGWTPMNNGGLLLLYTEYSTTTASASTNRGPYYDIVYNQGLFDVEGYRYLHRSVGYTADRDAENYAIGAKYTTGGGDFWSATARASRLHRDNIYDARNTVASIPTDYNAIELGWHGKLFGEPLSVDFGVETTVPVFGGDREIQPFGFVRWVHSFGP